MTPKPGAAALLAAFLAAAALPAAAAEEATIKDLIVAGALSPTERAGVERAVRAFYAFWNTGDEALLREALAPGFTDHTLPPGRPQGPEARPSPRAISAGPCPIFTSPSRRWSSRASM